MRAARYIGVPPWELEQKSSVWMYRAICAQNAEAWAEAEGIRRARKDAKK